MFLKLGETIADDFFDFSSVNHRLKVAGCIYQFVFNSLESFDEIGKYLVVNSASFYLCLEAL